MIEYRAEKVGGEKMIEQKKKVSSAMTVDCSK